MKKIDQILGFSALGLNLIYLLWLYYNIDHALGWGLFYIDCGFTFLIVLYLFNHRKQKSTIIPEYPPTGSLDIFLPVVNEPLELFERTVQAASTIDYENKTIYILDDGNRSEIKELAQEYNLHYICRKSNCDYKAGNLNYGLANSQGEFILIIDADHIVKPNIARELLGYFNNKPKLALVTTRQKFRVSKKSFNNDYLFYTTMQPGKNHDNAAFSTGSSVFYRRSALNDIGGFLTWNIVEDLYTTYVLHQNGFQTLYVNKSYATGLAPEDLPTIFKQRGIWALDSLRLFIWKNPLWQNGLTLKQRLHYLEIGCAYLFPALIFSILWLLLPLSFFLEIDIITGNPLFPLIKGLQLLLTLSFFWKQSGKKWSEIQFWIGLFPVYLKALLLALLFRKPKYRVTAKSNNNNRLHLWAIIPQLTYLGINAFALYWYIIYLEYGLNDHGIFAICWFILLMFWLWPVLKKGFGIKKTGVRSAESEAEIITKTFRHREELIVDT